MYYRRIFLFFQIALLQSICNFPYVKALVGNNIRSVNDNEVPYVVCIAKYSPHSNVISNVICSGSLVSNSHVMTAASCLDNLGNFAIKILLGSGHLLETLSYYPIWWTSYDQWTVARDLPLVHLNNNIAMMKLNGLNNQVTSGVLSAAMDTSVFYGLDVQLLGCGRTNNVEYTWRVQTAEARVLHHSECGHRASQIEGVLLYVSVNYICSSRTPYVQLTNGDNGGPLLYNGAIVGINLGVSPPYHGAFHPNKINIHLYLYLYRIFINHIIENDG